MTATSATVIATYSRRMGIELASGEHVDARIKGKRIKAVCGDRVIAEPIDNEPDWLITEIEPRDNELTRPNMRGSVEILAANIDALVVVAAASPVPDWFIVDRYLCAAELIGAEPIVVFNKMDLLAGHDIEIDELDDYRDIGLSVIECSALEATGTATLQECLAGKRGIIVGQSGVGKSSLINAIIDDADQATGEISFKSGEGRHTTVNSVMLPIAGGGAVIDSPGVRDYAPALDDASDAANGFREIANAAAHCRFANCRHHKEPGCNVKKLVEEVTISYRRYESYRRLVTLTEQLSAGRY